MDITNFLLWWVNFLFGLVRFVTGFEIFLEQFHIGSRGIPTDEGFCHNVRESIQQLSPMGSFEGEILTPSDGFRYGKSRDQYASVTYAQQLSPSIIALVASEADTQAAVKYASVCGYSVSIRSGGHSYLGTSSCDSSLGLCLQIDVTGLNHRVLLPNQVRLGPGNRLKDASEFLKQNGRFLPTGECPGVALGGHMQTGGFGLFARHFGPFVSRVDSFRIVLADGSLHQIVTPSQGTSELNDDLFYAVLGGASGSWGVVTEMTLNTLNDDDYFSVYWKLAYWWDTPEDTDGIVNMMRVWSQLAQERKDDYRWGAHWSVVGAKNVPGLGNRIQLEGSWLAPIDQADEYDFDFFQTIDLACTNCRRFRYINVTEPLSHTWRHRYIRTHIDKGTGREFPLPYTRAMQQFEDFPEPDEIENITRDIADLLPHRFSPHFVISQFTTMRGADHRRALPWPNDSLSVTLDYFFIPPTQYLYDYGEISRKFGEKLIANAKGKDHRMYWAAYDSPNLETDWPQYFESEDKYRRLQHIKLQYDPGNLFQNTMSIPMLPEDLSGLSSDTKTPQKDDTLPTKNNSGDQRRSGEAFSPLRSNNTSNRTTRHQQEEFCSLTQQGTCVNNEALGS